MAGYLCSGDGADEETIAESSAFVVMSHYGIHSADHSLPCVAGWADSRGWMADVEYIVEHEWGLGKYIPLLRPERIRNP